MFTIEADISKQIQKLNRFQRLAIPEAQKKTFLDCSALNTKGENSVPL